MKYSKLPDNFYCLDLFEFKWIIKELDEANNFKDKEIIFGVYFSLFYSIILPLSINNETVLLQYKKLIHKTMHNVIKLSKGRKDVVSCNSFIANLLYYLDMKSELSPVKAIIEIYRDDLDNIILNERDIVYNFEFVDKDIDFSDKAHITMCFKEYLSGLKYRLSNLYNSSDINEFRFIIEKNLCLSLYEIINNCDDLLSFNSMLKKYTLNELKTIVNCNEFDFFNFKNEFTCELIKQFDKCELDVFKLYWMYKITGYEFDDISNDKINIDDFSKELGIDNNTCNKILINMKKKTNKFKIQLFFGLNKTKKRKKDY